MSNFALQLKAEISRLAKKKFAPKPRPSKKPLANTVRRSRHSNVACSAWKRNSRN